MCFFNIWKDLLIFSIFDFPFSHPMQHVIYKVRLISKGKALKKNNYGIIKKRKNEPSDHLL